jgi:hypothetical protein
LRRIAELLQCPHSGVRVGSQAVLVGIARVAAVAAGEDMSLTPERR